MYVVALLQAEQIFSNTVSARIIILHRNGYLKMLEMAMYIFVLC